MGCGVWSAKCGLWNSTGKRFVQSWEYKVALRVAWCKVCSTKYHCEVFQMCQARVPSETVKQECPRKSVKQKSFTRVSCMSIQQECQTTVSSKSVPKDCFESVWWKSLERDCQARVSHKSVPEECQARMFCKSGF